MSRVPRRQAKINGRRWRIVTAKELLDAENPMLGLCDHADRTIYLATGPMHQLQDTLFHELIHAACPSLNEDQVQEVERGVYAALADNPVLREWMFAPPENDE